MAKRSNKSRYREGGEAPVLLRVNGERDAHHDDNPKRAQRAAVLRLGGLAPRTPPDGEQDFRREIEEAEDGG